jgi:hypothetical protein
VKTETPIGRTSSENIWAELVAKGFIDPIGKIQPSFNPSKEGFSLGLSVKICRERKLKLYQYFNPIS